MARKSQSDCWTLFAELGRLSCASRRSAAQRFRVAQPRGQFGFRDALGNPNLGDERRYLIQSLDGYGQLAGLHLARIRTICFLAIWAVNLKPRFDHPCQGGQRFSDFFLA
jgi:hypothetical protein